MTNTRRFKDLTRFGLLAGILVFINIFANTFYTQFDLTEENRFTLTRPTRQMLGDLKDRVYVQVLLDGDFPAGFKRLQTATRELLDDFRSESGYIDYQFEDPAAGTPGEVNARRKALAEDGIAPVNLRVAEQGETSQKLIYPVAIFHFANRRIPVKLLENESASLSPDQVINNSVSLLEYKFANAIKKLQAPDKKIILFTAGHGELNEYETADFETTLRQFYLTGRIVLDSVIKIQDKCALLVVAKPRSAFSEKDKFKIDQYVMGGGKVLWMIDPVNAELDSLARTGKYTGLAYDLNLEDILFKYGVRLPPHLVLDLECTKIPLAVGQLGDGRQLQLFNWYYHPAIRPADRHPIVKNLDRVEFKFCSSIDTVKTKTLVRKTPILSTSRYSLYQRTPVEINFDIVKYDPDPTKFNKGMQTVGIVLEGVFPSNYENRVSAEMMAELQSVGLVYKNESAPTGMVVISDGDVAANWVRDTSQKQMMPLGFNRFEKSTYANKDLVMNAVEYLVDPGGVIEARSKEVKLRLLDNVRAKKEKTFWQAVNIGVPLLLTALFAALFLWRRKKKYAAA